MPQTYRLTAEDVAALRRDVMAGVTTVTERARELGVSRSTVDNALYGWTWRSVVDPPPLPLPAPLEVSVPSAKLTVEAVADMRRRYRAGATTFGELAEETGVGESAVRSAVMGHTWRHCPVPPASRADVGGWTVVSEADELTIVRMRAAARPATYRAIAAATGLDTAVVWRAARRLRDRIVQARVEDAPVQRRAALQPDRRPG